MCESSEILQLQAEREFERDDFNRHINDLNAQNNCLYSENMKLKLALAESNVMFRKQKERV